MQLQRERNMRCEHCFWQRGIKNHKISTNSPHLIVVFWGFCLYVFWFFKEYAFLSHLGYLCVWLGRGYIIDSDIKGFSSHLSNFSQKFLFQAQSREFYLNLSVAYNFHYLTLKYTEGLRNYLYFYIKHIMLYNVHLQNDEGI